MKRVLLYISGVVVTVLLLMLFIEWYNFLRAVTESTKRIIKDKKSFFIDSLAFKGRVIRKQVCEKCDVNKFTIFIAIEEINQEVPLQYTYTYGYYHFNYDTLELLVNQEVFESVEECDVISKEVNSRFIKVDKMYLEVVAKEEYQWLP